MASTARDAHVVAAIEALREFMNVNLVASKVELEAKLIESHLGNPPFEPHHLHDARQYLLRQSEIEQSAEPTRGGSRPPLFVTTDTEGRTRRIADAAARKRLLMSRYYSYVQGTPGDPGSSLSGPAGEAAFDAGLRAAGVGARIATESNSRVELRRVFGADIIGGAMDNGFVLTRLDPRTLAPLEPYNVTVLVEVKNIREWVYPRTQELYQVLSKSAAVKLAHPEQPILPLLVCRRAHVTTRFMAKQLGFFVIETRQQYLPIDTRISPVGLAEIRQELGLADIVQGTDNTRNIQRRLVTLQRYHDVQLATEEWAEHTSDPTTIEAFRTLNDARLPNTLRDNWLNALRERARFHHEDLGW
jgi:hypothetical protein